LYRAGSGGERLEDRLDLTTLENEHDEGEEQRDQDEPWQPRASAGSWSRQDRDVSSGGTEKSRAQAPDVAPPASNEIVPEHPTRL
jgi:hypothetical protein